MRRKLWRQEKRKVARGQGAIGIIQRANSRVYVETGELVQTEDVNVVKLNGHIAAKLMSESEIHVISHTKIQREVGPNLPVVLHVKSKLLGALAQIEARSAPGQDYGTHDSVTVEPGLCALGFVGIRKAGVNNQTES
jgi:hypothetical protein